MITQSKKSKTTDLRAAASILRITVADIERLTPHQPTALNNALKTFDSTGFSKTTMALAVASWLERVAHDVDAFDAPATEALPVARFILDAVEDQT